MQESREISLIRLERRLPEDRLVEDRTEGVQVGTPCRPVPLEELRCQVRQRSGRALGSRVLLVQGESEVENDETTTLAWLGADEQVPRFQVAVDDVEVVEESDSAQRLNRQA